MKVFTNGCFDILHLQHIYLLAHCRKIAGKDGRVIVGINSDASVKSIKGEGRPITSQGDRMIILLSNKNVDEVHIFNTSTPYNLIYDLQPDCIVKGYDWKGREVVGWDLVPKGNVFFAPTNDSITTSKIIEKCFNLLTLEINKSVIKG